MVTFEDVSKKYSENSIALSDISFTVEDGEFIFFVGPSGAGKSTLLSMINLQLAPSSGRIVFDEFDYSKIRRKDIPKIRRKMGFIYQDYKLLLDRTVGENIGLPLEIIGAKPKVIKEAIAAALEEVGLPGKERMFPRELSGGEVQRVAIARAIITNPRILLCDEPTADLDDKNAWTVVRLLEKINESSKTTVLMATHNTEIVRGMGKHVISLEDGHIVSDTRTGTKSKKAEKLEEEPHTAETKHDDMPVPTADDTLLPETASQGEPK